MGIFNKLVQAGMQEIVRLGKRGVAEGAEKAAKTAANQTDEMLTKGASKLPDLFPEIPVSKTKIGSLDIDPATWAKAEEKAKEFHGGVMDELKQLHPKEYENTVFQNYQAQVGDWNLKKPHEDVGDIDSFMNEEGVVEFGAKEMKKDWETNGTFTPTETYDTMPEAPAVPSNLEQFVESGKVPPVENRTERDAMISRLKVVRKNNMDVLKATGKFDENDSIVVGKAMGEFRAKYDQEVNVDMPSDVEKFKKLVDTEQVKYDKLREKYKDHPPMTLYHGQRSLSETIKSKGFIDPTTHRKQHDELHIGAPSFTRDPNFNFAQESFGGKNAENFVSVEIPYADYEFSKVNMSPTQYRKRDINTILKVVTGNEEYRPLSIPSSDFYETESAIVEAEKLKRKGLKPATSDIDKKIESRIESEKAMSNASVRASTAYAKMESTESAADAYKAYKYVKDFMVAAMDNAKRTSTKTGLGQQYRTDILNKLNIGASEMFEISRVLREHNAPEKAELMDQLARSVNKLGLGGRDKPTIAGLNKIIEITPKLAKGGLASRK